MSIPVPPAGLVKSESYLISGSLKVTDRWFSVPLSYDSPNSSERIRLFTRTAATTTRDDGSNLPYLLYLQGGPGFECSPPKSHPITDWALNKGFQVIYLDQRGTGLSSPIDSSTENLSLDYLRNFRAPSIVRDAEAIRRAIIGDEKWSVLGQSFGGFCVVSYLSFYPTGLKEVFLTGGLPPLTAASIGDVYRALHCQVLKRNEVYNKKYPEDAAAVRRILEHLPVDLPAGGVLTKRRFLSLGIAFGGHGGIDGIHTLVLRAADELETRGKMTWKTLHVLESATGGFDGNPLYAVLHEAIYLDGPGKSSQWAADKVLSHRQGEDTVFTGEMVSRGMLEDYAELRRMREVAEAVAEADNWDKLYDLDQLAKNEVPTFAAVYLEDMYVDYELSMQTLGRIQGARAVVRSGWLHNAVRAKTEEIMGALWELRSGEVD